MNNQQLLLTAFVEECLEEMKKTKREDPTDLFNFGLGSADAAVRRVKIRWIEKLNNNKTENNVNN
jgi:hypothetical protein